MPAYTLRYRLDSSGPVTYLVERSGQYHIYTRGGLGASLPPQRLADLVSSRGGRWVPVAGELYVGGADPDGSPADPLGFGARGEALLPAAPTLLDPSGIGGHTTPSA